ASHAGAPGGAPGARGAELAAVRASIPAGSALVAYVRYMSPGWNRGRAHTAARPSALEARYLALVLAHAAAAQRAVDLGPASSLEAALGRWYREASTGVVRAPAGASERAFRVAGLALRKRLWDPVAPWLAGAQRVIIVPDGDVNLVNFATLPADAPGHYLV